MSQPDDRSHAEGDRLTPPFATLGIRILAVVIDGLIMSTAGVTVGIALGFDENLFTYTANHIAGAQVAMTSFIFAASAWLIHQFGGTPGKLILGLRVTSEDGHSPVSWRGASLRSVPVFLSIIPGAASSILGLGMVVSSLYWLTNDPQRRSAYDRLGSTRVIRVPK